MSTISIQHDRLTVICGDALESLRQLPSDSVQCCVTSPPYWGLRDYGTAKWDGGDSECDHATRDATRDATSTLIGTSNKEGFALNHYKHECGKCGAVRIDSQLGLEKTPDEYLSKMVAVFREVRRVLKNDGTLWLNLGDSYFGGGRGGNPDNSPFRKQATNAGSLVAPTKVPKGCKPKDLVGIPWMVAFALRADGWWLRQDIIWSKPNPMPESVTDRCTKAHEYLFLLTKSAQYYYDNEAIREPFTEGSKERYDYAFGGKKSEALRDANQTGIGQRTRIVGTRKYDGTGNGSDGSKIKDHIGNSMNNPDGLRNKRSVWSVTTNPFPEAHFATYSPDLIIPCVLAGSKANDVILDPFAGSGTTGMVALNLGRKALLIELNPEYVKLIKQRCDTDIGLPL